VTSIARSVRRQILCEYKIGEVALALAHVTRPRSGFIGSLSPIASCAPALIATATLSVETRGQGLIEVTGDAEAFVTQAGAKDGVLLLFIRHTSASLVIQENADPDVRADLVAALDRLAPADAGWLHAAEGADDMPAHVKSMLTGVSLNVPIVEGRLALGTWQGIYLAEHRARPHRRDIVLQLVGSRWP
jgi:secondary thiamine-phosphate synthase enzyme